MGLVAPCHVGSSQTRDRTRVPCIGRRILNHCATREVLLMAFERQVLVDFEVCCLLNLGLLEILLNGFFPG